jgi:adenosylcobinamide kinase/adenosylcobinamide-phosphate guanylyltransferase
MSGSLTFILGGARSGKSAFAQRLAMKGRQVLFVATAEAHDDDMARRIEAHRKDRPAEWDTLEEPVDLAESLKDAVAAYDTVVVDCLTLWVSNLLLKYEGEADCEKRILASADGLLEVIASSNANWIVVSNEVGLGIVPEYALGRVYRDALGRVNQRFAAQADTAYFMVAGLALDLKALGATPFMDA